MSDMIHSNNRRPAPYEDLRVMIGRMDGKLDIVLATTTDHGRRLSDLEAWKNRWFGWTLASAFAGGAGAEPLLNLLFR